MLALSVMYNALTFEVLIVVNLHRLLNCAAFWCIDIEMLSMLSNAGSTAFVFFGEVQCIASEKVILHLTCMPALLYGLKVKSTGHIAAELLNFIVSRCLVKLFNQH